MKILLKSLHQVFLCWMFVFNVNVKWQKALLMKKIASLILNLQNNKIEQKNVIFLHYGNGIRKCFIDKLEEEAVDYAKKGTYNLKIMSFTEFLDWINKV